MKSENENSVFPSFSSLLCSSGNDDVQLQLQMPDIDLSFPSFMHLPRPAFTDQRNVHWNESSMDSEACNDDNFGRFKPPSSINIPSVLNCHMAHIPGLLNAAATSSPPSMELNIAQKRLFSVSVPESQSGAGHQVSTIEQNTRKRALKIGDAFHNKTAKRKKIVCCEEQCHRQPQSEKPSVTHDEQMPPVIRRGKKLGDKIAALQKLVSPFGKTDTASVLHEAYVQIKLLQEQVQMLSAPYFRASLYHPQVLVTKEEDLRSRGLCLVPVSLTHNLNYKTQEPQDRRLNIKDINHSLN